MKYHKEIGFPKSLIFPKYLVHLHWTDHACDKMNSFGLAGGKLLKTHIYKKDTIEVEVNDKTGIITDIVVRLPYSQKYDIAFALSITKTKHAVIKTVWLNNKKDQHKTLDRSKYDLPDNYNSKEIDKIYGGQ